MNLCIPRRAISRQCRVWASRSVGLTTKTTGTATRSFPSELASAALRQSPAVMSCRHSRISTTTAPMGLLLISSVTKCRIAADVASVIHPETATTSTGPSMWARIANPASTAFPLTATPIRVSTAVNRFSLDLAHPMSQGMPGIHASCSRLPMVALTKPDAAQI